MQKLTLRDAFERHCLSEPVESLSYARKHWIPKNGRKPVAASTVWRWAARGLRVGSRTIRLEVVQCGGRPMVSREAIQRFFDALTAARVEKYGAENTDTAETDERDPATERRLRAAGILPPAARTS